jgi:hypothetical protein
MPQSLVLALLQGLQKSSNNCLVLPELEVNQLSSKTAEAAVNATNLTNPVVTLEAEVANPWRARCLETCTSGSEGGGEETC